jgi:hypothetical protein
VIGVRIIQVSWISVALVAVTGLIDLVVDAFDPIAVGVCVVLFLASLPVWVYAFGLAVVRSGRGDDIAVASLFFLAGSAPATVRNHLLGAFVASIVVAAITAWANPFVVLVPMFPLGLAGLWAARHGTFPRRRPVR